MPILESFFTGLYYEARRRLDNQDLIFALTQCGKAERALKNANDQLSGYRRHFEVMPPRPQHIGSDQLALSWYWHKDVTHKIKGGIDGLIEMAKLYAERAILTHYRNKDAA